MYLYLKGWLESIDKIFFKGDSSSQYFYNLPFCTQATDDMNQLKENIIARMSIDKKGESVKYGYLWKSGLPLPCCLARKHMSAFQGNSYFIADKSDGFRFLLVGDPNTKQTYLVDRSFRFGKLKQTLFGDFFYRNGTTIIDGELITTSNTSFESLFYDLQHFNDASLDKNDPASIQKKHFPLIFNMFDLITNTGENYANLYYKERLDQLDKVYQQYRETYAMFEDKRTLCLNRKFIVSGKDVETLISLFELKKDETAYIFSNKGLKYICDGLIITPDKKVYAETHQNVYKWKLPKLNTVDLKIVYGGDKIYLKAINDTSSFATVATLLYDGNTEKLNSISKQEYDHYRRNNGKICEFGYDIINSKWVMIKERTDKMKPNFITTVISVLTTQAENIRRKEIRKYLGQPSGINK